MKIVLTGGEVFDLGATETTPTVGIIDYSRRSTDDFGITTVVERGFARTMSARMAVPFDSVDAVQRKLASLRATSAKWVADDSFASLTVTGFFKDFSVDLATPPLSYCTLTLEGLTQTEVLADSGADPAPTGQASTLKLLQPTTITNATLIASTVAENDYPAWSAATTYALGARVLQAPTHRIYESAAAGNLGNDPTTSIGKWLDIGPTKRWAMFDQALGSATIAAGSISVTVDAAAINAVALLDVVATSVRVQATGYDRTLAAGSGTIPFLDLPAGVTRVTVTITGSGTVSVGTLLVGRLVNLGVTEASPSAGITDYSRKNVDGFGAVTIVPRAWAKRMTAKALISSDAIDAVFARIAAVRATPALWIGQAGIDSLSVYGFFKDFSIEVGDTLSTLSLSIEGLSEAAKPQPLTVDWPNVGDPKGTKPADNATVGAPAGTYVGSTPATALENAIKDASGNIVPVQQLIATDLAVAATARADLAAAKTSLSSDITVARAETAQVRTDLVPTITAAKAEGSTARAEVATARADLATEVSRATGAETNLSTRSTALENNYRSAALSRIPDRLANNADWIAGGAGFAGVWPLDTPAPPAPTVVSDGSEGSVVEFASGAAINQATRTWLGVKPGKIYRATLRARRASGSTSQNISLRLPTSTTSGLWLMDNSKTITLTDSWADYTSTVTGDALLAANANAAFVRAYIYTGVGAGNTVRVASLLLQDVTTEEATNARIATEETTRANAVSAISARTTTLETALNTPTTGVVARLTTEETARAAADSALANRATSLETALNTPTTGLTARIGTEETTRASADAALATRATNLESTVNNATTGVVAANARITSEETTRAAADSALATRASTLESKSYGALNANPFFASYTNTTGAPDGWTFDNTANAYSTRVAGETGGFALQVAAPAGLANCYTSAALGAVPINTWWVVEADVKLVAGSLNGAGVLFRTGTDQTLKFAADKDSTDAVVGAGAVGTTYRFRKLFQTSAATTNGSLYAMTHWGNLGDVSGAATLIWYRCAVRPASDGEIKAQKADAALNAPASGVLARLTTEEATRAAADSALATRATNLETTLYTPSTGLSARMGTEETTRASADSALAARASNLETTIYTASTGLQARMGAEETTRASADSALATRASNLETTIYTPSTGLQARIGTEETTRASADSALATRATNLESAVNNTTTGNAALQARIAAEETTRATAVAAVAGRAATLESRVGNASNYTSANATFTAWPDSSALPAQWGLWAAGTFTRETAAGTSGGYMVGHVVPSAADSGLFTPFYATSGYWVYEASVWCSAGTFQGAGLYADGLPGLNFSTVPDTNGVAGVGGPGIRNWSFMTTSTRDAQANLYAMGNWSAFGTTTAKTLHWLKAGIRPATDGEIRAMKADAALNAPGTGVLARLTTEETTRAAADSALATRTSTMEASLYNGSTGLAAALARIANEETARANADSVLASRASVVEASALKGGNLLASSVFVNTAGWGAWAPNLNGAMGLNIAGAQWQPVNENALSIRQGDNNANQLAYWYSDQFAVTTGQWYQFSAYVASHRADAGIGYENWSADGASGLGGAAPVRISRGGSANGGQNLAGWDLVYFNYQATNPLMRMTLLKWGTNPGSNDSYAWFIRPQVVQVANGNAPYQPYAAASGSALSSQTLARVSTAESAIVDQATKFAQAAWTVSSVTPGGRAAITVRSSSAAGAGVDIVGDVNFAGNLNVGPDTGQRTKITNNGVTVIDANNVLRVRLGLWS